MSQFKKILYPCALTEVSSKVAKKVRLLAEESGAELHLMFVILSIAAHERVLKYHIKYAVPDECNLQASTQAEAALTEFRKEYFGSLRDCKIVVRCGDIAEEILKYAKTENVDLIAMGTHGRRAIAQVFVGSVAVGVLHNSPVPVYIVNPHTLTD